MDVCEHFMYMHMCGLYVYACRFIMRADLIHSVSISVVPQRVSEVDAVVSLHDIRILHVIAFCGVKNGGDTKNLLMKSSLVVFAIVQLAENCFIHNKKPRQ